MADDDELTMTPEYEFEWEDGSTRNTADIEDGERFPEALETLAMLGREDPDCEVTLLGFGN